MYGSEWSKAPERQGLLYLFDLVELRGQGLVNEGYQYRYLQLQRLFDEQRIASNWRLVMNYSTHQIDSIWESLVATDRFEGVIFRQQDSRWFSPLLRAKKSLTEDLRIIGFEEGKNRLTNCLGAVVAIGQDGVMHTIGGGFTDKRRREIWSNQTAFLGRTIIVEAKKKFASGQLRHPCFKGFHPEK
jgi:ATP-dependent DNA ligase